MITTYERYFDPKDVAAFKRVKRGAMILARVKKEVLTEMVGGTLSVEG